MYVSRKNESQTFSMSYLEMVLCFLDRSSRARPDRYCRVIWVKLGFQCEWLKEFQISEKRSRVRHRLKSSPSGRVPVPVHQYYSRFGSPLKGYVPKSDAQPNSLAVSGMVADLSPLSRD